MAFLELLPWQKEVVSLVECRVEPRVVHWFWSPLRVGKTMVTFFLQEIHDAIRATTVQEMFEYVKIFKLVLGYDSRIRVYDLQEEVEELDYEELVANNPHVIVLARSPPCADRCGDVVLNIHQIPDDSVDVLKALCDRLARASSHNVDE